MIKKYGLLTVLLLVAFLMLVVKVKNRNVVYQPISINPTPTARPTINYKIYPLWDYLPHTEKDFVVEKYIEANTLEVKIISGNKTVIEKKVNDWLKNYNLREKQIIKFNE
ncbi:MAG TPA: hypothetical protein PK639_03890 [Candidatus Woesebacteria bacterium]|nr:hypothetical protein [Candidatus Woesebacteria bacterium]